MWPNKSQRAEQILCKQGLLVYLLRAIFSLRFGALVCIYGLSRPMWSSIKINYNALVRRNEGTWQPAEQCGSYFAILIVFGQPWRSVARRKKLNRVLARQTVFVRRFNSLSVWLVFLWHYTLSLLF